MSDYLDKVISEIRERIEVLRPAVEEHRQLEQALAALEPTPPKKGAGRKK